MFLDLWSLVVLTSDFLELIVNHVDSVASLVSLPFLTFLGIFIACSLFAWRSTWTSPHLPPAPRPPYVIQISATGRYNSSTNANTNGGLLSRASSNSSTLADVRLLSSNVDVDRVLRRFPSTGGSQRGLGRVRISETRVISPNNTLNSSGGSSGTSSSGSATGTINLNSSSTSSRSRSGTGTGGGEDPQSVTQTRTNIRVYQQQQQGEGQAVQANGPTNGGGVSNSSLLGLLRPSTVIRPFLQRANVAGGGSQAQNLIVYHRVNVRPCPFLFLADSLIFIYLYIF